MELTFPQLVECHPAPPETLQPRGILQPSRNGGFSGRQISLFFPLKASLPTPPEWTGVVCFLGEIRGLGECGRRALRPLILVVSWASQLVLSPLPSLPPPPNTHTPPPPTHTRSQRGFNIKQTQRAPPSCALGRVCAAAALQIVNLNCSPDSLPPLFDFSQP